MCKKPLVTCYMLTYNRFEYIYKALDSILMQEYPNIELAIFDDCSEQFPEEELLEYIEKNKRHNIKNVIIKRNDINVGTVKNINNVIKNTHGKYLLGAGIDDELYDKHVFENVVKEFEEHNAYVVTCYKYIMDSDGHIVGKAPSKIGVNRIKRATSEELFKMVSMGVAIAGAGTYYSRKIFEKSGYYDERYRLQEDGPFYLRILREGYTIHFADIIAVKYRLGNGVSSSSELHPELKKDINNMLANEVLPYIDKFNFWEKRRIYYQVERFRDNKLLSLKQKIKYCLKYPDVILYRKIMAN